MRLDQEKLRKKNRLLCSGKKRPEMVSVEHFLIGRSADSLHFAR